MATPTIAPPAAAPSPATPTPAAAPSTPAVPSTPSPTPAPAAEPQSMEDKLGAAWKTAKDSIPLDQPAEPAPAEAAAPTVEEPPAPAAEPAPATEPEAPAEVAPEFELSLDDGEAASPETLFKELKADPVAAKFFEDRPELKNKVMAALRRDTENREIRQIVPDVETAKQMHKGATLYSQFDNNFLKATTPEGYKGFIDKWVEEALIIGDDGQPQKNADGSYKVHPSLPYIMNQIHENQAAYALAEFKKSGEMTPQMRATAIAIADSFLQQAKLKGGEEGDRLETVANLFKEALTPQSSATEEIPAHLKSLADSLKAKETALTEKEQAADRQRQETARTEATKAHEQSIVRAESKAADTIKGQLKPAFTKAGLTEFESNAALNAIGEQVDTALAADGFYQSMYDSILLDAPSEAREKRLYKHMLTYTNQYIGKITADVLRAAKGGSLTRQTERATTVEGQKKASQADPRGTSISAASPQQKITNADIEKEYIAAHDGEKPSLEWVLGEVMKRNRTRPA